MKKTLSTILLLGLAASSIGACASYNVKYKDPSAQRGTKHELKQAFFFYGIFGGSDIDLQSLCPTGVAEISSAHSVVDGLAYVLTAGLYTPVSVEVHCKGGTAYRLDKSEDKVNVAKLDRAQTEQN